MGSNMSDTILLNLLLGVLVADSRGAAMYTNSALAIGNNIQHNFAKTIAWCFGGW